MLPSGGAASVVLSGASHGPSLWRDSPLTVLHPQGELVMGLSGPLALLGLSRTTWALSRLGLRLIGMDEKLPRGEKVQVWELRGASGDEKWLGWICRALRKCQRL